jgi:hypothetical protein
MQNSKTTFCCVDYAQIQYFSMIHRKILDFLFYNITNKLSLQGYSFRCFMYCKIPYSLFLIKIYIFQ